MRNNNKINTGETADVKVEGVIDYQPLDTADRDDDNAWNVMKFYGESDGAESDYESPQSVEIQDVMMRLKANRIREKLHMMSREVA